MATDLTQGHSRFAAARPADTAMTAGPRLPRLPRLDRHQALQCIAVATALVVLLPLAWLVLRATGAGAEGLAWALRPRTLTILANSIVLTVTVVAGALAIGLPFAWLTARCEFPLRRFWLIAGLLTMVVPSYLGAVTLLAAFGPRGLLYDMLATLMPLERLPDMRGWFGAWLSITLITWPFIALPARAVLLGSDPALEEAARSLGLGRWKVFRRVTLPLLRPALAGGSLLVALYTLSDFGAVAVMRYNAFTRAIYLQYTSSFDRERAAILALMLILLTLLLLLLERRLGRHRGGARLGAGAQRRLELQRIGRWRWPAVIFCSLLVVLGVALPVGVLGSWLTRRALFNVTPPDMGMLTATTASVSALAALAAGALALPLALLLRRRHSRLSHWLVALTHGGNVLPGIVVALALVFFAARYLPAWYQTVPLLLLGYVTRFLPLAISASRSALESISPRLEEAARGLGQRPWQVVLRVYVPLARAGILAGIALVFLSVMKELPTTLVLAPIGTRTFATHIWSAYSEALLSIVGGPGLLLLGVSALGLVAILLRERQPGAAPGTGVALLRELPRRARAHALAVLVHLR